MSADCIEVLHVDDDPSFLELAKTVLDDRYPQIDVETETDPRAAVDTIADNGVDPAVDCVVCDYDMPYLDGLDVLEAIRDAAPRLPFILYTGKGSEEIASEAISRGVNEYMQKEPGANQFELLANRIRNLVERTQTKRALETSEAKFRALVEQNLVGIYLIQDGVFTYVNPRLAETFGYEQDDVVGMEPTALVGPDDRDLVEENLRKRLEGEVDTIRYSFTGLRSDGEEVAAEVQGRRVQIDGSPAIVGVLVERA